MTPPMLKKILTRCAVLMLLGAPAAHAADSATVTPVIPLPAQVVPMQGTFRLGPGTTIVVRGGDEAARIARDLADRIGSSRGFAPRVGSDGEISLKKAEETIGKPIYWQIPNDSRTVIESRNQGVPLITQAPRSKVHQAIAGLALAVIGKEAPQAGKEKSRGWALFSRG